MDKSIMAKGFNQGYQLYIQNPDLAVLVSEGFQTPRNSYCEAFLSGVIQCVRDRDEYSKHIDRIIKVERSLE